MNVFSAKFSPDGNFIGASYASGMCTVHTTHRVGLRSERMYQPKIAERSLGEVGDPFVKPIITSIAWRPVKDSAF